MDNILIIGLIPYGYNTDWYKYAENLSNFYNVYYLCRKDSKKEITSENVNIIRFEATSKTYYYKVLFEAKKLRDKIKFKKVFVYVYPSCSLMRMIFSKEQLVMDIRTSYIKSPIATWICNRLIKIESIAYGKISVISWGVADFLNLKKKKCCYLPLGGEALGYCPKDMNSLRLFYVGTFYDRNIHKTVEGFAIFKKNNPDADVTYTIAGVGSQQDIDLITGTILKYGLEGCVKYVGEKRGESLKELFRQHNVGVSYIPLTDYYDCQPPTKTFEYLLATMVVLATPTSENRKVVNDSNGYLSKDDSPIAFANSIEYIYDYIENYNLEKIYRTSLSYTWSFITSKYLLPLLR